MKQFFKNLKKSKFAKSSVAMILAFSVLLSTFAGLSIFGQDWNGSAATGYESGKGTEGDPYIIADAGQLLLAVTSYDNAGVYYKLANDITINDTSSNNWYSADSLNNWAAPVKVTDTDKAFRGNFDGDGHKVFGLYINQTVANTTGDADVAAGLFPLVGGGAVITGVGIENAYVKVTNAATDEANKPHGAVGGLVGAVVDASSASKVEISLCYADTDTRLTGACIGGILGSSITGNAGAVSITNCYTNSQGLANTSTLLGETIAHTFDISNRIGVAGITKVNREITFAGCYSATGNIAGTTSAADSAKSNYIIRGKWGAGTSQDGLNSTSDMMGETAKTNMPLLSWDTVYKTGTGYPELVIFDSGEVAETEVSYDVWSGGKEQPTKGSGTETDPYLIYNGEQLAYALGSTGVAAHNGSVYYKLVSDIYLNDLTKINWTTGDVADGYLVREWKPTFFAGTIDGNGHIIYGMYIDEKPSTYAEDTSKGGAGLISENWWNESTIIKNLGIDNAYVRAANAAAAFVGITKQGTISIDNSFVGENVTLTGYSVGGAVAYGGAGTIYVTNFYSLTTRLNTNGGKSGGILGDIWSGNTKTLKNSFAVGTAYGNNKPSTFSGVYSAVESQGDIYVSLDNMKGEDALTSEDKMPLLGDAFTATEGLPVLKVLDPTTRNVWDGTTVEPIKGTGTANDPILINSAEEFAWVMQSHGSASQPNYKLTTDIYLNDVDAVKWTTGAVVKDGYTPNQWDATFFAGTIDGAGHMIYGLYIEDNPTEYKEGWEVADGNQGLVSENWHGYNVTFKNIGLDSLYMHSTYSIGAFVGQAKGSGSINFENAFVGADSCIKAWSSGGFIGYGLGTVTMTNCYSLLTNYTANGNGKAGGVLGNHWSGGKVTVANSYAVGCFNGHNGAGATPAYTNSYQGVDNGASAPTVVSPVLMTGTDVLTNENKMPLLGDAFVATTSYPILKVFYVPEETDSEVWDGTTSEPTEGAGTFADPILIGTAEELAWVLQSHGSTTQTLYYKLTADIYLNDISKINWQTGTIEAGYTANVWTPTYFTGIIDGDNHVIYGLYNDQNPMSYTESWSDGLGLISEGKSGYTVTFSNLGIDNVYFDGANSVGVFVGNSKSSVADSLKFDNCYVGADVTLAGYSAGGFVGYGQGPVTISNAYSLTTAITANGGKAGAIIGDVWGGTAKHSITNAYSVIKLYGNNAPGLTNVYSPVEQNGVTLRTAENMQGLDALTSENKMSGLGDKFHATTTYPILASFVKAEPIEIWDGTTTKPASGDGSYTDPYLITNGSELAWAVKGNDKGKYYKLTKDIYLNEIDAIDWETGEVTKEGYTVRSWTSGTFNGYIDGDGHMIYGLYINNRVTSGKWTWTGGGLIAMVNGGATTIEKLGMDNVYINHANLAGAFVGVSQNMADYGLRLTQCFVGANTTIYAYDVGGMVGVGNGGVTVDQSYSLVSADRLKVFSGAADKRGGILGGHWGSNTVTNSYTVYRVYGDTNNPASGANAYATVANGDRDEANIVTAENMQGLDALSNSSKMEKLAACGAFMATDTYPVLKVFQSGTSDDDGGSTVEGDIWSGKVAKTFAEGKGTEAEPYLISNGAELALAITKAGLNGSYFKLTKDIYLNDVTNIGWEKNSGNNVWLIGTSAFNGHIDGDGYIVYGIFYPDSTTAQQAALVPYFGNGSIKNLGVRYSYIKATLYAGGIVGCDSQNTGANVKIVEQCFADETCTIGYTSNGYGGAAGIWGYTSPNAGVNGNPAVIIKNCYSKANITGQLDDRTNGIIGTSWACAYQLTGCYSVGQPLYIGWNKNTASKLISKGTDDTADDAANVHSAIYTNGKNPYALETWTYIKELEDMQGTAAKTNMADLDWDNVWEVVSTSTPKLKIFTSITGEDIDVSEDGQVYESGNGTKNNPYIIKTSAQLRYLVESKSTYGKYYKLGADIYVNDTTKSNWKTNSPAKWYQSTYHGEYQFQGTLDGDGHSIYGLFYNDTPAVYEEVNNFVSYATALFPCVTPNASVYNVHIRNSYLSGYGYTGSIYGFVQGGAASSGYALIQACSADESVTLKGQTAGGLVGGGTRGLEMYYCYFTGTVDATAENTGRESGLVGDIWSTDQIVAECYTVGYTNYRPNYSPASELFVYGTEIENGTILLSKENMTGDNAKKYMDLSWGSVWYTAKGKTPQLKVVSMDYKHSFTDEGEVGRVWSGKLATGFAGGSGTADDPYLIETPEQMAYLVGLGANKTLGKHFKLVADLKINDTSYTGWQANARNWLSGGTEFGGHFDGNGHVVSGLYFDGSARQVALFPRITGGAVIEKVGVINSHLSSYPAGTVYETYVAAIAAYYGGWTSEELGYGYPVISQCFADDTVTLEGYFVGGIACGSPSAYYLDNCYFTGEITAQNHHGTMLGNIWSSGTHISKLTNCYSSSLDRNQPSANNGASHILCEGYYHDGLKGAVQITAVGLMFMKGDYALTHMPDLDYDNIWKTVEGGTPVLRCFKNAEQYSLTREPAKVKIEFVTGDGTKLDPIEGIPGFDPIPEELPVPELYGYDFGGWYYFQECDIEFDLELFPEFDTVIYAKWIQRGFTQDFEGNVDETYDVAVGTELFKPGVAGYNPRYVHGGLRSIHVKGDGTNQGLFLLSYDNMLEVGQKYDIYFWVNTSQDGASGKVELLHANHGQVNSDIVGHETAFEFTGLRAGSWTQFKCTVTANAPFLLVRTPADVELYFDDIQVVKLNETGELGQIEGFNPATIDTEPETGLSLVWIIAIIAGGVVVLAAVAVLIIVLVKKKKNKKDEATLAE